MKNLVYFIGLTLVVLISSCNQNSDQAASTDNQETKQIKTQSGDIKPVYLTAETFKEKVWDYENNPEEWKYEGELPCIVDFYADWCKPCKIVAPIMDDLADYYDGQVLVYKVNTDEQRELSTVFQVRSIPAILFAPSQGKPAMQPGALSKEEYIKIIDEFVLKNKNVENKKNQS